MIAISHCNDDNSDTRPHQAASNLGNRPSSKSVAMCTQPLCTTPELLGYAYLCHLQGQPLVTAHVIPGALETYRWEEKTRVSHWESWPGTFWKHALQCCAHDPRSPHMSTGHIGQFPRSHWGDWVMNPNMRRVRPPGWPPPLGNRTWQDTSRNRAPFSTLPDCSVTRSFRTASLEASYKIRAAAVEKLWQPENTFLHRSPPFLPYFLDFCFPGLLISPLEC